MRTEKNVAQALRALAEENSRIEARPELEARVVGEYRRRLKNRGRLRAVTALAAAAAIAVAIFAWRLPHAANAPVSVAKHAPAVATQEVATVPAPAAVHPQAAHRPPRMREITTEFFPLLDAPPPVDRGELLRVTVPAATMRAVGLPVADDRLADRVQADVVVSEDGLATAIRFVKHQ